eukprot:1633224-Rhodomonas_salina.1
MRLMRSSPSPPPRRASTLRSPPPAPSRRPGRRAPGLGTSQSPRAAGVHRLHTARRHSPGSRGCSVECSSCQRRHCTTRDTCRTGTASP